ncbi:hypothetical protein V8G54_023554 [Vigna mungo]|uniref:Uncharacterized protein n=1 Tax=Vigna mungo TaxID=3915 RepID=A0AAQ3RRP7_VIGMU
MLTPPIRSQARKPFPLLRVQDYRHQRLRVLLNSSPVHIKCLARPISIEELEMVADKELSLKSILKMGKDQNMGGLGRTFYSLSPPPKHFPLNQMKLLNLACISVFTPHRTTTSQSRINAIMEPAILVAKEYQCGHTCKLRCHGPKPPPKPEFTLKPKKKNIIQQSEGVPGTPCPPCPELVWRSCVGQHIGADRECSPLKIYVVILYHVAIIIVQKPVMPWIANYEEVNHVKIVIFVVRRKESLHVHTIALGHAILETVLHARCSLSGHVTVKVAKLNASMPRDMPSRLTIEKLRKATHSLGLISLYFIFIVLLSNMAYADVDESLIEAEEDGSQPDRDQDLKPRFHGSDEAEDDDDDVVNTWNLRKCSATALDILSNVFGDEILPTLMPIVEAKLSAGGNDAWKEREAAVLALGAIGEDCINGLYPHLLEGIGHPKGYEQFDNVLTRLLRRILDDNNSVLGHISHHYVYGLTLLTVVYCSELQRRNLRIVYDAIGTLAEAVRGELNQIR